MKLISKFFTGAFFTGVIALLLVACQQPVTLYQEGQFPERLSDWGILSVSGSELVLHHEVVAYDLNSPLFTDYAHKLRTIWIPEGAQATYDDATDIQLPVGSIVSKTFYYPRDGAKLIKTTSEDADYTDKGLDLNKVRLIETRLMIHLADGWHGLPYVWNDAQTEARLEITGAAFRLELTDVSGGVSGDEGSVEMIDYLVPDFNQCQGCHVENLTSGKMGLIGPKVRHLNKAYGHLNKNDDQLVHLQEKGWLVDLPSSLPRNAAWHDVSADLGDRARSYLDINCGHCHNPTGAADTSGLFLHRAEASSLRLGLCKPPVAAGQGTGGRRYGIKPGDGEDSILTYRMESLDLGAMMPELGRSTVHEEGLTLIKQWIDTFPGSC